MVCSTFDLFKIGVGPSSSHTMGPMTAACRFVEAARQSSARRHRAGGGDSTDRSLNERPRARIFAPFCRLAGERRRLDPDAADLTGGGRESGRLLLAGTRDLPFDEARDVRFNQRERLPHHSNGMRFTATLANGDQESQVYYSVGGGAVVDEDMVTRNAPPEGGWDIPYRFSSAAELLDIAERERIDIADISRANERARSATRRSTAARLAVQRWRPASIAAWRSTASCRAG